MTRTASGGKPTAASCGSSCWAVQSDDVDGNDPVAALLEAPFGGVQRSLHGLLVGVGALRARRDAPGRLAHRHQGAGHLTALGIGVGVPRDEQLLEYGPGARRAQAVAGRVEL